MPFDTAQIKLIAGNANLPLAQRMAEILGVDLVDTRVTHFSDGETWVEINENMRGKDVFVIQPTSSPVNEHLMELLILIDALKRASAATITAVIPYYGYARQDRKTASRSPISAKLVADMLQVAGIDRLMCMDLHSPQIQGFFNVPVDNLYAQNLLAADIIENNQLADLVVVSPDVGGVARARATAKLLGVPLAIIDKRRPAPNQAHIGHVIGDVRGKTCIIVDDMVDTAGTVCEAAHVLCGDKYGATRVLVYATHGVLSGPALERLNASDIDQVVVTNAINQHKNAQGCDKIRVVCAAPLLAEAVRRLVTKESLSALFTAAGA